MNLGGRRANSTSARLEHRRTEYGKSKSLVPSLPWFRPQKQSTRYRVPGAIRNQPTPTFFCLSQRQLLEPRPSRALLLFYSACSHTCPVLSPAHRLIFACFVLFFLFGLDSCLIDQGKPSPQTTSPKYSWDLRPRQCFKPGSRCQQFLVSPAVLPAHLLLSSLSAIKSPYGVYNFSTQLIDVD